MEMNITHTNGMQFVAETRQHKFQIDVPPLYKGEDTGPTPPELLAAAFGSCIGMYALMYMNAQNLPTQGLKIKVNWEEVENGKRIGKLTADLHLPEGVTPEQAEKVLKAAESCKIHHTLATAPEMCVSIANEPTTCLS